jgi:hypothetical protein
LLTIEMCNSWATLKIKHPAESKRIISEFKRLGSRFGRCRWKRISQNTLNVSHRTLWGMHKNTDIPCGPPGPAQTGEARVVKLYAERTIESCSDILEPGSQRFPSASDLAVPAHSIGENLRHAEINCRDVKAGQSREEIDK